MNLELARRSQMLARKSTSTLHLQIGQETIYLLLTAGLFATIVLAAYVARLTGPEKQPPIVSLKEADGFYFEPGSPEISQSFDRELRTVVLPKVVQIADDYNAPIIEVVGHTDEVPLSRNRQGNLDAALLSWFLSQDSRVPVAQDNVGLGMARAVAVARSLRAAGLPPKYVLIPLSAGPFVKPGDQVTDGRTVKDSRERRRIEIRLRRPSEVSSPSASP